MTTKATSSRGEHQHHYMGRSGVTVGSIANQTSIRTVIMDESYKMSSGWDPDEDKFHDHFAGRLPVRGSLGQLIERCTSAPLPSSSSGDDRFKHGDLLVGNDLLDHVTRGHLDVANSQSTTPLIHNGGGAVHHRDFGTDLFLGTTASVSGRATAPTQHNYDVVRPLSASGDMGMNHQYQNHHHHLGMSAFEEEALDFGRLGGSMVRSRSAQPSLQEGLLRPPPGLSSAESSASNQSRAMSSHSEREHLTSNLASVGHGIRRPASTGVLGSQTNAALRPSAKTLMDLIQEDFPDDIHGTSSHYDILENAVDRRSASPAIARYSRDYGNSGVFIPSSSQYVERDGSRHFQQNKYGVQENMNVYERSKLERQQPAFYAPQHQRYVDEYGQRPVSPEEQKQQQHRLVYPGVHQSGQQLDMQQGRYLGDMGRRQTSAEERHVYAPLQQPISHHLQQQPPQQQHGGQLYYSHQHRVDSGVPMHPQVIQSGQTLFVNSSNAQPGYGYATIQYQGAQQPQIIHHQSLAGALSARADQYVSVVPIQGGGAQLAYWQADQQPGMGTAVAIVNPSGTVGAPIAITRLSSTSDNSHLHGGYAGNGGGGGGGGRHGRGGGEKGGRGRRNAHARRGESSKSSTHSVSSPVLEEFRSSKSRDWTMRHIEGYIVEFCQDQNGSRFIQQRLELGDAVEQQIVMKEVLPAIRRLRNDVFGNYVVQKLLDFGTPEMKADIRTTLEGEMLQLSLQMYGCRVVQKALETLDEDHLPRILMEFHHNVLSCIHDQNGNHVIQKCIEVMNSRARKWESVGNPDRARFLREQIDFIVNDVLVNTATLSCHPYGCRVLQRILEHCDEGKKELVLDEIQKCHQKLLDDQYGNYVIQHVLQFGRASDRDSILKIIVDNGLLGLSRQKFASNVVEKLLKHGNGTQRRTIAREMLKIVDSTNSPVSEATDIGRSVVILMVRDAYANYVVQTTLDVVPESEERQLLLKELNLHADDLRNYTFAKHIVTKLATLNNVTA